MIIQGLLPQLAVFRPTMCVRSGTLFQLFICYLDTQMTSPALCNVSGRCSTCSTEASMEGMLVCWLPVRTLTQHHVRERISRQRGSRHKRLEQTCMPRGSCRGRRLPELGSRQPLPTSEASIQSSQGHVKQPLQHAASVRACMWHRWLRWTGWLAQEYVDDDPFHLRTLTTINPTTAS